MSGQYTFTSPSNPSSFIPQSGTANHMPTNLVPSNQHYGPTIPYPSTSNITTNNPGYSASFPMPVQNQDPLYSTINIQSPHLYSQQPDPSTKWQSWSNPMPESWSSLSGMQPLNRQRPKLTTTLWEDENTVCFQVDAKGICVARRQDNNMVNGTKLLNVTGMSRGKRDGILKNEKGRIVVKVGAMHLKGVWIPLQRAKALVTQFKIQDLLFPLLVEDPSHYLYSPLYSSGMHPPRMSLPSDTSPYIPDFRNQQQNLVANHPRLNYDSQIIATNDTHSPGSFPQQQSRDYASPYRYSEAQTDTHSSTGMSHMPTENLRAHSAPFLQGHQDPSSAESTVSQSLINPTSQHSALDYTGEIYTHGQNYDAHRKLSEQSYGPADITRKRNLSSDANTGVMFSPMTGRNYSFSSPLTLSPCSLPSPSMTQKQHDMSPMSKRTKILRYDPRCADQYNQHPDHQAESNAAGSRAPAPIGQESLGLIFGTLSPPESDTDSPLDHRPNPPYRTMESTQPRFSHHLGYVHNP